MKLSEWRLKVTENAMGVLGKISGAADKTAARFGALTDQANKFSDGLHRAADKVPGLNKAFDLITDPFLLAGAGVAGLAAMTYKATTAAANFNHQFLELKNLNLDKTKGEIDKLNSSIMKVSMDNGLDPKATAKAYFDIQSATGKYGAEVDKLVERIGQFSIATKTDFDAAINGAAKAMVNFGVGANNIDQFLASSFKTVQVGITTFDQLAQVQTEYAAAAAGANQNFDTANKLFAAFTQTAKNVDIAANLTKTAFQGLIDPNVIQGLQKYGISMFDAQHHFRKTDDVVHDLAEKFKGMNDIQFAQFMGKVGGPEGMRALLINIRTQGDKLLDTFNNFDNTKFDINKALANAKGDFTTLKTIVGNQFQNIMIQIGQKVLPMVARAFDTISRAMEWVGSNKQLIVDVFSAIWTGVKAALIVFSPLLTVIGLVTIAVWAQNLAWMANPLVWIPALVISVVAAFMLLWKRCEGFRGFLYGLWGSFKEVFMSIWDIAKNILGGIADMVIGLVTFDVGKIKSGAQAFAKGITAANPVGFYYQYGKKIGDKFHEGYNDGVSAVRDNLNKGYESKIDLKVTRTMDTKALLSGKPQNEGFLSSFMSGNAPAGPVAPDRDANGIGDNQNLMGASTGMSGEKQKVVNITFSKGLVNEIHIHAANVRESAGELQRTVLETLARVLNGAEQTIAGE